MLYQLSYSSELLADAAVMGWAVDAFLIRVSECDGKRWGGEPRLVEAGRGNRTLVFSLEGYCSTIELHPQVTCHPPDAGLAPARQG